MRVELSLEGSTVTVHLGVAEVAETVDARAATLTGNATGAAAFMQSPAVAQPAASDAAAASEVCI